MAILFLIFNYFTEASRGKLKYSSQQHKLQEDIYVRYPTAALLLLKGVFPAVVLTWCFRLRVSAPGKHNFIVNGAIQIQLSWIDADIGSSIFCFQLM